MPTLYASDTLAAGQTIILKVFKSTDLISSSSNKNFSQMTRSLTQDGFHKTSTSNEREFYFVTRSNSFENRLNRYYLATSETSAISSTS